MQDELLQLLAGRRGHFRMESGYHSESWFDLDRLLEKQAELRPFVSELARRIARHRVDAVCGPMTGGATLAKLIASELGVGYLFAERIEPPHSLGLFPIQYRLPLTLRDQAAGKSVAIVDDAISAGSAVRGTVIDLIACGAKPVAMGALVVFGERATHFAADHRLALEAIARMTFRMWKPGECPLCRAGAAIESVSESI